MTIENETPVRDELETRPVMVETTDGRKVPLAVLETLCHAATVGERFADLNRSGPGGQMQHSDTVRLSSNGKHLFRKPGYDPVETNLDKMNANLEHAAAFDPQVCLSLCVGYRIYQRNQWRVRELLRIVNDRDQQIRSVEDQRTSLEQVIIDDVLEVEKLKKLLHRIYAIACRADVTDEEIPLLDEVHAKLIT